MKYTNSALFLDRDGIIIEDGEYLYKTEDIIFIQETIELVKKANKKNMLVIVVTNQAGVAKGLFSINDVNNVNYYIKNFYTQHNAIINDFFISPYHEKGIIPEYTKISDWRKPEAGMILAAQQKYNINIETSIMVGDKDSDIIKLSELKCYLIQGKYEIKNKDKIISLTNLINLL